MMIFSYDFFFFFVQRGFIHQAWLAYFFLRRRWYSVAHTFFCLGLFRFANCIGNVGLRRTRMASGSPRLFFSEIIPYLFYHGSIITNKWEPLIGYLFLFSFFFWRYDSPSAGLLSAQEPADQHRGLCQQGDKWTPNILPLAEKTPSKKKLSVGSLSIRASPATRISYICR